MDTLEQMMQELKQNHSTTKQCEWGGNQNDDACPICHGDEWIYDRATNTARPCKCRAVKMMQRRLRFADIPIGFENMTLDNFDKAIYKRADSQNKLAFAINGINYYISEFKNMQERGKGLYIYSNEKGSGKTRMAVSITNELLKEHQVKFSTSPNIIQEIRDSYNKDSMVNESDVLDHLYTAEILVIDDFGAEKLTDWVNEKFYSIINRRYLDKKVTIYTSNIALEDLEYDNRIKSRVLETAFPIAFPEESVRKYIAERDSENMLKKILGGRKKWN